MIPNLLFILRRRWPILLLLPISVVVLTIVLTPKAKAAQVQYTTKVYVQADTSRLGAVALQQAARQVAQASVARAAAKRMGIKITDPKSFGSKLVVKPDLG